MTIKCIKNILNTFWCIISEILDVYILFFSKNESYIFNVNKVENLHEALKFLKTSQTSACA